MKALSLQRASVDWHAGSCSGPHASLSDEMWCLKTPFGEWPMHLADQPPKPYRVRPWRLSAYTTSSAVTVLRRACSV